MIVLMKSLTFAMVLLEKKLTSKLKGQEMAINKLIFISI